MYYLKASTVLVCIRVCIKESKLALFSIAIGRGGDVLVIFHNLILYCTELCLWSIVLFEFCCRAHKFLLLLAGSFVVRKNF